jgi:hypothetical protein
VALVRSEGEGVRDVSESLPMRPGQLSCKTHVVGDANIQRNEMKV